MNLEHGEDAQVPTVGHDRQLTFVYVTTKQCAAQKLYVYLLFLKTGMTFHRLGQASLYPANP